MDNKLTIIGRSNLEAVTRMVDSYYRTNKVVDGCGIPNDEDGDVRFEFWKAGYSYRHRVSFSRFNVDEPYHIFQGIIENVEKAFAQYNYVDTTNSLTKRAMNSHYGKRGQIAFGRANGKSLYTAHELMKQLYKYTELKIKNVIFADPATIVFWEDGTKTVVRTQEGDIYDPEKGLAMAICKKIGGNKWDYYNTFKHWLKKYKKPEGDYEQVTYTTKLIMEED